MNNDHYKCLLSLPNADADRVFILLIESRMEPLEMKVVPLQIVTLC